MPFGGPDQNQGIDNQLVTPARKGASPIKSAMTKRLRPEGSEDDVLQVEEELEGKRAKRVKKVAFDPVGTGSMNPLTQLLSLGIVGTGSLRELERS
jgi:hypothetical protein